ncbi:MAG: STAS domain-containing protein [Promicromonosporaceae bacterium]|nr:STAS domain-containing protein [Promicromonosporaceae bacterium]
MPFTETDHADYIVLAPTGKFNMVSAPLLKTRMDDLVAAGKARLIIDMSSVEFIDSSGLGALIGGLKGTRQAGGELRLAAPGDQARAVLKLTNLDRILTPYKTVEEAADGW